MNSLGMYFGPRIISVAESKKQTFVNSIAIPQSRILGQDFQEKIPEEIKISMLFKEELKRAHIDSLELSLVVSGRDLIIRTFDMPVIPQGELFNALTFEVRKYIPFRVEDLVFDFQVQYDKTSRKNFVLFAGIKKDILSKYLAILKQLNMKITGIDYSGFSILRLLLLTGASQRGITAFVDIDILEEDEINFMVLNNGFPLFNRDIVLPSESALESVKTGKFDVSLSLEKFKSELRVSLDFYHRKFPNKRIEKIYFICGKEFYDDLLAFSKEKNLPAQFIDFKKFFPKSAVFSSSLFKAFGGSIASTVKTNIKIDLMNTKFKNPVSVDKAFSLGTGFSMLSELRISPKAILAGLLICLAIFFNGIFHKLPLEGEMRKVLADRPNVLVTSPNLSAEELKSFNTKFKKRVELLKSFFKKRIYITKVLDAIPRYLPDGLWITGFKYRLEGDRSDVTLLGIAYLDDADKELETVNSFLSELQNNSELMKYFTDINIASVDHGMFKKSKVTNFTITLRNQ